jgi:2-methylcitrate dehydratase PrpD
MSDPLVYNDATVKDPLVRSLAKNMELVVDKSLHETPGVIPPAEVEIVCGGKTYKKATTPHKGSPLNPFNWDDVCEKFSRYTRTFIDATQAQAIMGAVANLENLGDMASVATLLAKT